MHIKPTPRVFITIGLLQAFWLLCGCGTWKSIDSPNGGYYSLLLLQKPNPTAQQIFEEGLIHQSEKPVNEAWRDCLKIAAQSQGVLMIDDSLAESPRMVIACGLPAIVEIPRSKFNQTAMLAKSELFDRNDKKKKTEGQFIRFMDVWLAIAVKPGITPGTSKIAVACYDPSSQAIQPFQMADNHQTLDSSKVKPAEGSALAWNNAQAFRPGAASNWADQKNTPEVRWKSVPLLAADDFLINMETQFKNPSVWAKKLSRDASPIQRSNAPAVVNEQSTDFQKITQHGNWCAAYLRRTVYLLDCPNVVSELTEISHNLLRAARHEDQTIHIYVIASPDINAFSLPNGDIYICAGLLDMLDDADEAAAVLAHEIDHYLQNDATRKICSDYKMETAVEVTTAILSSTIGAAANIATAGAAQGVPELANSVADLARSAGDLSTALSAYTTTTVGSSVHRTFIMGYSQETELRADANAVRYLWAAGYDPNAFCRIFTKLERAEILYKEQNQLAVSNLINCKPGLKQRDQVLKAVLKNLPELGSTR